MRFLKKKYKEGRDFVYEELNDLDLTGIRLLRGKFKDFLYVYGAIGTREIEGRCQLSFTFQVLESNQNYQNESLDSFDQNTQFVQTIGDILTHIIETEESNDTEA